MEWVTPVWTSWIYYVIYLVIKLNSPPASSRIRRERRCLDLTQPIRSETSGVSRILPQVGIECTRIFIYIPTHRRIQSTVQPDRLKHDRHAAYDVNSQYSSAMLPTLSSRGILPPCSSHCALITAKKEFVEHLKNVTGTVYLFQNFVRRT